MTDHPATEKRWGLAVYLRGSDDPAFVPQESRDAAIESVAFVATTWLRFPPEARPASCWLVARDCTVTIMSEQGVANLPAKRPLAVFDPREVQAVQVVAIEHEAWKE